MKVLIVDDNEDCILLLRQTLDSIPSVEVTAAYSVAEAWWHLTAPKTTFHLLITDLSMPMLSGMDLIQRIRSCPSHKDLRIVLCTAVADRKIIELCAHLDVSQYIVKPFNIAILINKIKLAAGLPP